MRCTQQRLRQFCVSCLLAIFTAAFASMPIAAQASGRGFSSTRATTLRTAKDTCTTTSHRAWKPSRKMGGEKGFAVDVSDDPAVFTESNLKQYAALVFSNSNNQAFASDAQRDAFQALHRIRGRLCRHFTPHRARSATGPTSGRCWEASSPSIRGCSPSRCGWPILILQR